MPLKSAFVLEVENYLIRIVDESDTNDFYEICNNDETCKYLTFRPFKSLKETKKTIDNMIRAYLIDDCINFSIYFKNIRKVIGSISITLNKNENGAEIGYLLNHNFFNKKIMSKILPQFIKKVFEYYNFDFLEAYVNINNIYSIKLLEKNNFKLLNKKSDILKYLLKK